jgi:3-oxoacyl-[acyl-carrier-protein] synthase-3
MYILGMGSAHPKTVISNKFLEDLDVGTSAQWIEDKIGILERVSILPLDYIKKTRNQDPHAAQEARLVTSTDLAIEACTKALAAAKISPAQVGLLICNCCTPDQIVPAEGQRIAWALDMSCRTYEVTSACPAFALHMDHLNSMQEEQLPDFVLCVSTAALTQHVNYNDRSDGAIWGDGAAAWVVSKNEKGRLKVVDTSFQADPTRCSAVAIDRFSHFHQDGRAVRDFSVRQTVRLIKKLEETHSLTWENDIFIGHQANRTMLEQITANRGIRPENHWHNVSYLGNQAGAGAPATLAQHWEQLENGQRIAVAVVGAGLSWGSILCEVV